MKWNCTVILFVSDSQNISMVSLRGSIGAGQFIVACNIIYTLLLYLYNIIQLNEGEVYRPTCVRSVYCIISCQINTK